MSKRSYISRYLLILMPWFVSPRTSVYLRRLSPLFFRTFFLVKKVPKKSANESRASMPSDPSGSGFVRLAIFLWGKIESHEKCSALHLLAHAPTERTDFFLCEYAGNPNGSTFNSAFTPSGRDSLLAIFLRGKIESHEKCSAHILHPYAPTELSVSFIF
jgi:hypothetical protein